MIHIVLESYLKSFNNLHKNLKKYPNSLLFVEVYTILFIAIIKIYF